MQIEYPLKLLSICFLVPLSLICNACILDSSSDSDDEIYEEVDQMPELIGGLDSLNSKIIYPELARRAGIEGRVIVGFVVTKKGKTVDHIVTRGIGGGCDEEAVRVIKTAEFIPGVLNGEKVNVRDSLILTFRFSN